MPSSATDHLDLDLVLVPYFGNFVVLPILDHVLSTYRPKSIGVRQRSLLGQGSRQSPSVGRDGAKDLGGSDNRWWNGSWEIYGFGPIQKWSESLYRRSEERSSG
jgi:hypothetical protein